MERLEERVVPSNYMVTSTASSGTGSLAAELALANADNTSAEVITFSPTVFARSQTITLGATLALTNTHQSITINASTLPAASLLLTISGNNSVGVFSVAAGVTAVIENLTITGGSIRRRPRLTTCLPTPSSSAIARRM